jgi:hypothetical protein
VAPNITATPNLGTAVTEGQTVKLGVPRINGLNELWFDGSFSDTNISPLAPSLNASSFLRLSPNARSMLDTSLSYSGTQMDARAGGLIGADTFGAAWVGKVVIGATGSGAPLTAGAVTFGTNSDDASTVFVDANQNGIFEANEMVVDNRVSNRQATTYSSVDVPKVINPNIVPVTISNLLLSGVAGTISDVNIRLNITHTWVNDLDVFLIAPDGTTRIELFTDVGADGTQNFTNTVLPFAERTVVTVDRRTRRVANPSWQRIDLYRSRQICDDGSRAGGCAQPKSNRFDCW